ncbi:hypothetical protein [Hyphomonas johnsonii]|uniref:Uncharacterized protein n=1 Tax=Hyphomonas johnsonii MHS-2 TaxID=1280950 RepID=A0A059FTX5_9PROT|nr:hypothetical protein [Hyphomonas johnsonii]KCZ93918.1 hypothetical protein HJO_01045 [Hyphomonas johnsonii MHS-2]
MRSALLIFSALTAGIALGRKFLAGKVTDRKNKAIEAAAVEARERIRKEAHTLLTASFAHFAVATGIKALILGAVWLVWRVHGLTDAQVSLTVATCLVLFLIRDMWVIYPTARFVLSTLVRNGWHPKRALGETVAALVFEQVLVEAKSIPPTRSHTLLLALAGHNRDVLHQDIAGAVADVARQSSWPDLKPFILSAILKTVSLMLIYSVLVTVIVAQVR